MKKTLSMKKLNTTMTTTKASKTPNVKSRNVDKMMDTIGAKS